MKTIKGDSYINAITGMGLPGTSKSTATWYAPSRRLGPNELQNLYSGNGYAARIIDRMVEDATRCDFKLIGSEKRFDWWSVRSQLDTLGAMQAISDAWKWGRLYGGGLLVLLVNDGKDASEPLDLDAVRELVGFGVLDSSNVQPLGWSAAIGSSAWQQPTGYQILMPADIETNGKSVKLGGVIHPSRCVRFDAMPVPAGVMSLYGGWSPSLLQRCCKALESYGTVLQSALELAQELSVMVLGVADLINKLKSDEDTAGFRKTLRALKQGIDSFNLLAIDKDNMSYQEVKRSVEGIEKLINSFERDLVGQSGIPRLILTGEQASGLGASSSDEVRSWYDSVAKQQKAVVAPALDRILEVIFAARANAGERVPNEWTIEFAPLHTPEPKASAEIAKTWVDTAAAAVAAGLMTIEQAQAMLIQNGVLAALPTDDEGEPVEAPTQPEAAPEQEAAAPTQPTEESQPVAAQALNGAQVASLVEVLGAVGRGELAPAAAERIISVSVPSASIESIRAAVAAAAASAPPPAPVAPAVAEQTPTDESGEPEEEPEPEIEPSRDPIPADAMPARDIAAKLGVYTGRVTRLVKEGRVRMWNKLGLRVISLAEIHDIIASDNETEQP